jgi:hypothetical protein
MSKSGGKKNKTTEQNNPELMPSLVFNNIKKKDEANLGAENKKRLKKIIETAKAREKSKGWMTIGAVSLSIIIIILWGYALINKLILTSGKKTEEGQLVEQSKNTLKEIFEETKENELQKQVTKMQIKEILKNLTTIEPEENLSAPSSTDKNPITTTSTKKQ